MSFMRKVGWEDLKVPGLSFERGGPNPPDLEVFRDGIQQPAFTGAGVIVEQAFTTIHLPHDMKSTAKLYPHVHWSHNIGSPSGDVVWQLEITRATVNSVFEASTIITLQQTVGTQYQHKVKEVDEVDALNGSLQPDELLLVRIFRDPAHANDTFENDAFFLELDLHYESDGMLTNEKRGPFTKKRF